MPGEDTSEISLLVREALNLIKDMNYMSQVNISNFNSTLTFFALHNAYKRLKLNTVYFITLKLIRHGKEPNKSQH